MASISFAKSMADSAQGMAQTNEFRQLAQAVSELARCCEDLESRLRRAEQDAQQALHNSRSA